MKKILLIVLVLISFFMISCKKKSNLDVTYQEVISSYEALGYSVVLHDFLLDKETSYAYNVICMKNDEVIEFYFFDTDMEAEDYRKDNSWNFLLWLAPITKGKAPFWVNVKRYNNIVIKYEKNDLYIPFNDLIENKNS